MEALRQTFDQYAEIVKKMSASQRGTLVVVTLLVVGGFAYVMFGGRSNGYVAVLSGKNFTAEEMKNAVGILNEQGKSDFRVKNGQLLVRPSEAGAYEAILMAAGGLPDDWASELDKQREKSGVFASLEQSRAGREIALARQLRSILRKIPAIADGSVVWARSQQRRTFGRSQRVTATVNVTPKSGHELSVQMANSLRIAVARMVPDLKPSDVTVFNTQTGVSHSLDPNDPRGGWREELIKYHTERYSRNIEKQLAYIPGVLVTVDVKLDKTDGLFIKRRELDPKKSLLSSERTISRKDDRTRQPIRAEPGQTSNRPRSLASSNNSAETRKIEDKDTTTYMQSIQERYEQLAPAMVEATQVSVAIPETYFAKVAELSDGGQTPAPSRQQIIQDVKAMVATIISADPTGAAVDVRTFVHVDPDIVELETSWLDSAGVAVNQWGGAVALGFFALCALWILRKSMPKVTEVAAVPVSPLAQTAQPEAEVPIEPLIPPEPTRHDMLQSSIRDNPEMAAAVLSKWLTAAAD